MTVNQIQKLAGIESKYHDILRPPTALTTSEEWQATNGCLNLITQGDGESNRDGRKVVITSIHMKGHAFVVSDTQVSRVVLVQDTQTNGTAFTPADVFSPAADNAVFSFRNLTRTKRFKILMDKTFGDNEFGGSDHRTWEFNKKVNIPVEYSGNLGTIADIVDNSLHLIVAQWDYSGTVVSPLNLAFNTRIRFVG